MAHRLAYDPDARLVLCRFSGQTTGAELAQACTDFYGDPRWRSGMDVIADLTNVSQFVIDPEEMQRLVETVSHCRAAYRPGRVFYAARTADHYFAVQAFAAQVKRRGWETIVVHSLREALTHLGLDALPPGLNAA